MIMEVGVWGFLPSKRRIQWEGTWDIRVVKCDSVIDGSRRERT